MSSSGPPPNAPILTTSLSITRTLTDFLTVAIHTILYTRSLYPPTTFLTTRHYNLPVQQSRHPKVCAWILSFIASLTPLLHTSSVSKVVLVIYSPSLSVLERYIFDISRFPIVPPKEKFTEFENTPEGEERGVGSGNMNAVDVEEQLRATILRLQDKGGRLGDLPEGCTFTVAVELRDEKGEGIDGIVEPPIGHPQAWVPSEPSLQISKEGEVVEGKGKEKDTGDGARRKMGKDIGGVKSTPVRLVEAGDFIMETWIEEGKAKFEDDER